MLQTEIYAFWIIFYTDLTIIFVDSLFLLLKK